MGNVERSVQISREEGWQSRSLWFGVLTGPFAWAAQIIVLSVVGELNCASAVRDPGVLWGLRLEEAILIANVFLTVLTAAAGLVSYRCLRSSASSPSGRAEWMARIGVMSSILFLIFILLGFAPQLFLSACEVGP